MTGKSFQSLTHAIVLAVLLGSQVSTAAEVEGQPPRFHLRPVSSVGQDSTQTLQLPHTKKLVGAASYFRPFCRDPIGYPCPPVAIEPSQDYVGAITPGDGLAESAVDVGAVAPPSIMAGALGAAPAPGAVTPNMIGDFFGGGMAFSPSFGSAAQEETLALAGGDRRFKIVESNRPIPTDRLFSTTTTSKTHCWWSMERNVRSIDTPSGSRRPSSTG